MWFRPTSKEQRFRKRMQLVKVAFLALSADSGRRSSNSTCRARILLTADCRSLSRMYRRTRSMKPISKLSSSPIFSLLDLSTPCCQLYDHLLQTCYRWVWSFLKESSCTHISCPEIQTSSPDFCLSNSCVVYGGYNHLTFEVGPEEVCYFHALYLLFSWRSAISNLHRLHKMIFSHPLHQFCFLTKLCLDDWFQVVWKTFLYCQLLARQHTNCRIHYLCMECTSQQYLCCLFICIVSFDFINTVLGQCRL